MPDAGADQLEGRVEMASGAQSYERKAQTKENQKKAREDRDSTQALFTNNFYLRDKEFAVVRFLEQGDDLSFADTHRVPVQGAKKSYFRDFVCLDVRDDGTPCPACQHSDDEISKRVTRGFINLIWRQAPVFQRDENKRPVKGPDNRYIVIGREDQIALWKCSWTVFELLKEKDRRYKGLMSRDWEIKRTGSQMNDTLYYVEFADAEAGPMMIADLALATDKYDLHTLTTPLSFADLAQILNRGAMPPGQGAQPSMNRDALLPTASSAFTPGQEPSVRAASVFTRS